MSAEARTAAATEDEHSLIQQLSETYESVSRKSFQEAYHDALQIKEEAITAFNLGVLDLKARARVEELFWATCERILKIVRELDYVPDELEGLETAAVSERRVAGSSSFEVNGLGAGAIGLVLEEAEPTLDFPHHQPRDLALGGAQGHALDEPPGLPHRHLGHVADRPLDGRGDQQGIRVSARRPRATAVVETAHHHQA